MASDLHSSASPSAHGGVVLPQTPPPDELTSYFAAAPAILSPRQGRSQETQPAASGTETPTCYTSRGDLFVLFDVREGFRVGCDCVGRTITRPLETTGQPLCALGLAELAPGPHLVSVTAPGSLWGQGYWFVTEPQLPGHIRVKQWNRQLEILEDCSPARARAFSPTAESLQTLRYIESKGVSWKELSSCISERVLRRVTHSHPFQDATGARFWPLSTVDTAEGEDAIPLPLSEGALPPTPSLFFQFPRGEPDAYRILAAHRRPRGIAHDEPYTPATEQILHVVDADTLAGEDLVGELQLAFITGAQLQNATCVRQWHYLVCKVYLLAPDLVKVRPRLCRLLVQTLHAQIRFMHSEEDGRPEDGPEVDFFGLPRSGSKSKYETQLQSALSGFKRGLEAILLSLGTTAKPEQVVVGDTFAALEATVWQHGWDLRIPAWPVAVNSLRKSVLVGRGYGLGEDSYDDGDAGDDGDDGKSGFGADVDWLDLDSDEDDPVFVELDENGNERGLVSWD